MYWKQAYRLVSQYIQLIMILKTYEYLIKLWNEYNKYGGLLLCKPPSTLCLKNWAHIIMPHNSRKCGPMLIILSLSHSQMKCR